MSSRKLDKFGGLLPAWEAHLIPDGQATEASNAYVFSGALTGWRTPKLLRQLTNSAAKFAYRLPTVTKGVAAAYFIILANPLVGDTVTLGDVTYTWTAAITSGTPQFYVLIGATALQSLQNLFNAWTFDQGTGVNQGVSYSNNTEANSAIATPDEVPGDNNAILGTVYGNGIRVIAPDYGAAFNATAVAESTGGSRTIWLADLGSITHTTTTFQGGVNPSFDPTITSSSQYLEFLDPDTTVVKSQVVNDAFERYYFSSPSVLPEYNTRKRINAGQSPFYLGIPPPACAPVVSVSGGGNTGQLGVTKSLVALNTAGNSNTVYLFPVVPTGAISAIDVSWVPGVTDTALQWQAAIYNDLGNGVTPTSPGLLLAVSPVFIGVTQGTTAVGSFTNPPPMNQSQVYWIGVFFGKTTQVLSGDSAGGLVSFTSTFSNGLPPVAPAVGKVAQNFNMWLDFETSDILEARAYVYTWISAYGEESAPSPFTLITGWSNATWTIGLFSPPSDDLGTIRNLAVVRVYRTVTGTSGLTTYYAVADISLGSTDPDAQAFVANDTGCLPQSATFSDTTPDNVVAINNQLQSTNFFPPPEDLVGMVSMPNGVVAAWKNNEVWFCEPYFPHAWPPGNVLSVEFPIVGLGVTSGAVVACTSSNAYVISGPSPGNMSLLKCPNPQPCTSRGSVLGLDSGVYYISPNGLIQVPSTGQLQNLTQTWIKKEDWAQLVPLKNTRAIALASTYFCWGTTNGSDVSVAQTGFNVEVDTDTTSFTIWPQAGGHRIGFMPMSSPLGFNIDNLYIDPYTGNGVLIMNGGIYWYDFTDQAPAIQAFRWKSKKYQEPMRKNYSALRTFFTVPPNTPAQAPNANIQPPYDASWNALQNGQWGIVKVYADPDDGTHSGNMVLVMARELRKNGQIMRIPDGFKAENWQVEVLGRVSISNIQIATSVQELGDV